MGCLFYFTERLEPERREPAGALNASAAGDGSSEREMGAAVEILRAIARDRISSPQTGCEALQVPPSPPNINAIPIQKGLRFFVDK